MLVFLQRIQDKTCFCLSVGFAGIFAQFSDPFRRSAFRFLLPGSRDLPDGDFRSFRLYASVVAVAAEKVALAASTAAPPRLVLAAPGLCLSACSVAFL